MTRKEIELDILKTNIFVICAFLLASGIGLFLGYLGGVK